MKKILPIMLAICVLAGCSGNHPWTRKDTAALATYTVFHVADWMQTRQVAKNPDCYREINPILGEHPSTPLVDAYFAFTWIANYLITRELDEPYRTGWQIGGIAIEAGFVIHNNSVGVKLQW